MSRYFCSNICVCVCVIGWLLGLLCSLYGDWWSLFEFDEASSFDVTWMSVRVWRSVLTCHSALINGPRGWVSFVFLSKLHQSPYCDVAVPHVYISDYFIFSRRSVNTYMYTIATFIAKILQTNLVRYPTDAVQSQMYIGPMSARVVLLSMCIHIQQNLYKTCP